MTIQSFCVLISAAMFLAAGCGKKGTSAADAVRFNDGLVASSKRVTDSAKAFGEAVGPAVDGGIEQVAKAKRELENVEEALQRAEADVRLLKVPESPAAKAFYDEHQKLLKHQEQMVKEEFRAIVKVLNDPLLSANDRRKKISPMARYIQSMDQGSFAGIRQAQAAFAKEHGFRLK